MPLLRMAKTGLCRIDIGLRPSGNSEKVCIRVLGHPLKGEAQRPGIVGYLKIAGR